jgi:hypothetical protein
MPVSTLRHRQKAPRTPSEGGQAVLAAAQARHDKGPGETHKAQWARGRGQYAKVQGAHPRCGKGQGEKQYKGSTSPLASEGDKEQQEKHGAKLPERDNRPQ